MGKIIWIASYPKSGNTWMRGFLHNLINADNKPLSINTLNEFVKGESAAELYRQFTNTPSTSLDPRRLASLRPKVHHSLTGDGPNKVFIKTHSYLGQSFDVPTITPEVTAGAIYIVRNPLDICISLASHIGKSLDEAIDFMRKETAGKATATKVMEFWNSWSTNVSSWTKMHQPEIKVIRYEDLLDNKLKYFCEVVKFLRLDASESRVEKAIEFSSFDAMRHQEEKESLKERPPHSPRFFRKGIRGEWREKLTKDQVNRLVGDHHEQMERFGYLPG